MPLLILFLPRERDFLGSQIVEIEVTVAVQRAKNDRYDAEGSLLERHGPVTAWLWR